MREGESPSAVTATPVVSTRAHNAHGTLRYFLVKELT
jgi:hypothetical protein